MAKHTIRIDSALEAFLHSAFKSVNPIYPGKLGLKKKAVPMAGLSFFEVEEGNEKPVMTSPFVYSLQASQEPKPCILVLSTSRGTQCLPGRTSDLRQGIIGGIAYQVGLEGDFFTATFKRTMHQVLSDAGAGLAVEPDFAFLPKLIGTFPALSKEASLLEDERRVWKIEQLDDTVYLKAVDKALKRLLDRLFAIGKDATDKKTIYQNGINSLIHLQKQYKARLAAILGAGQLTKAQEFQYLAGILKSIQASETTLGAIKLNIEAYPTLGERLNTLLIDYYSQLKQIESSYAGNSTILSEDYELRLKEFQNRWVTLFA